MNVFKSLSAKLFLLAVVYTSVAILPCVYVGKSCGRRIEKCSEQMNVVQRLNNLTIISNGIYAKEAGKPLDIKKIQDATEALNKYYETLATKNIKAKSLFSKNALSVLRNNSARDNAIAEMANFITEKTSLFSDSRLGIRLLMDVSGVVIPSIESEIIVLRHSLNRKGNVANVVASSNLGRILAQTRAIIVRLSRSSTSTEYKIQPEVFEKLNKLNSHVVKIERLISQKQQLGADKLQIEQTLDLFVESLNELWDSVNANLTVMLENKSAELVHEATIFWLAFGTILLVLTISGILISRVIVRGVDTVSTIVKVASAGEILKAKSSIETSDMSATYAELNEGVEMLVGHMAELIESARDIANASSRINIMLNGMNATKVPMIASIKNFFVEADKQIKSDYDFVLREVALLAKCSEQITTVEKHLKSAKKLGGILEQNNHQVFGISTDVINRLTSVVAMLDKISGISITMKDAAERVNLLGLNLAVVAKKLGKDSNGTGTLSDQIRLVSKQIVVAVVDVEAMCAEITELVSDAMGQNSKIIEISDSSASSATEIDTSSAKSLKVASDIGSELNSVASALRSNISTGLSFDEPERDLDDLRDTIKNMATIVKKASETVEALRSKLR